MSTVNAGIQLEVINCWVCGCTFAVSCDLKSSMKSREDTLFCPKGCRLGLGEPHWKEKLKRARESELYYKELAIEKRELAERTGRQLTATRGVVTRFKNRVSNGVCPCCNRQFTDLTKHMEAKHPNYASEDYR